MPNHSGTAIIDYYLNGGAMVTVSVPLQAGKVTVEQVNHDVGPNQEVSARVNLPNPGTAERVIHFDNGTWHGSTDKVGATHAASEWDFAEGSTLAPYDEYLTLQNPASSSVSATLSYQTESGDHPRKTLSLPAKSRTTVEVMSGDLTDNPACTPGAGGTCGVGRGHTGVAVRVTAGAPLIVERPFYVDDFSFGFGAIRDGHVAPGANQPARTWYFAEGTTLSGFNEYLTLQNPGSVSAAVTLDYFTDSGRKVTKRLAVPPLTRSTVLVFQGDLSSAICSAGVNGNCGIGRGVVGVSLTVSSDQPIVAERPMYVVHDFGTGIVAGASDAVGASQLGTVFGFSAGSTQPGDNEYLTIENPSSSLAANIRVAYYTSSGIINRTFVVGAATRHTVLVFANDGEGAGPGFDLLGIVVTSDQGVLVEKPSYSSNPATYGATDTMAYSPAAF